MGIVFSFLGIGKTGVVFSRKWESRFSELRMRGGKLVKTPANLKCPPLSTSKCPPRYFASATY